MSNKNNLSFSLRSEWLLLVLLLGNLAFGAYIYPSLPDQVPSHWNFQGEVDAYSSPLWGAFGIPLMNLGFFAAFFVIPRLDPRKEKYSLFTGAYRAFRYVFHLLMISIHLLVISAAKGVDVNVSLLVPMGVSILFITIGNYMGKIQWNYFFGIKTPWTLENETVWKKTHRMAGPLWVGAGLTGFAAAIIGGQVGFFIFFISIITAAVLPLIYSYLIFRKVKDS